MTSLDDPDPRAVPANPEGACVGVIGIGRMGLPIVGHLVNAGYRVCVYDVDPGRVRLAQGHAVPRDSVAAVARGADIVVTVLPGAAEFRDVILGDAGALASMRPGSAWVDLTSNDPRVATDAAAASVARGIHAVGAPMGGGVEAAQRAELEFFAAGEAPALAMVHPLLQALAKPGGVHVVGADIAHGYSVKLLINLLWFGQVAAVTEAMLLAERLGVPPGSFRTLLAGSAADSAFAQRHLDRLLEGDYMESFGLRECVEELEIVSALADEQATPFDLSAVVTRLHRDALSRFGAVEGEMLVAKLLRERGAG